MCMWVSTISIVMCNLKYAEKASLTLPFFKWKHALIGSSNGTRSLFVSKLSWGEFVVLIQLCMWAERSCQGPDWLIVAAMIWIVHLVFELGVFGLIRQVCLAWSMWSKCTFRYVVQQSCMSAYYCYIVQSPVKCNHVQTKQMAYLFQQDCCSTGSAWKVAFPTSTQP